MAEDVQAQIVADRNLVELGRGEFEDFLPAGGGEGGSVEPADQKGKELGLGGGEVDFFDESSFARVRGGRALVVVVVTVGGRRGAFKEVGLGVEKTLEVG